MNMKSINLIMFLGSLLFFSCNTMEDDLLLENKLNENKISENHFLVANEKMSSDCNTCSALNNIKVSEIKKLGEKCTEYKVSWDYDLCYGRQSIFVNGMYKSYLMHSKSCTFTSCDNFVKVQIIGHDHESGKWDDVCFEKNISNIAEYNYNLTNIATNLVSYEFE